jgi:hypothetical protein
MILPTSVNAGCKNGFLIKDKFSRLIINNKGSTALR